MKKIFVYLAFIAFTFFSTHTYAAFCNTAGSLVSVKKTKSGRTEYVIFTVKLPYAQTPTVSTTAPPFTQDGSGDPITIAGCKYKQIVFNGIDWMCTIREYWNATNLIRQVKRTGQFEGVISYVVGYKCTPHAQFAFYSYTAGGYKKYVMRFRY